MNPYFYTSTVFRSRRETMRIYLQLGPAPYLRGITKDGGYRSPISSPRIWMMPKSGDSMPPARSGSPFRCREGGMAGSPGHKGIYVVAKRNLCCSEHDRKEQL